MAKKKTHKKKERGIKLCAPNTPGAYNIDFTSQEGAVRVVDGTFQDLIRDGHNHPVPWLCGSHADPKTRRAAVLLGRGESATLAKCKAIAKAGIPVLAINDVRKGWPKPRYWCSGDPPGYFSERIWTDPDIMKFIGLHNKENVRPRDGAYEPKKVAREAPNVFFFHQATDNTDAEHWLFHPFVSWGTTIGCENCPKQLYEKGAARSSMLIGLKLLFFLGYRDVYLVGCDCAPHHHPESAYWETIFHLTDSVGQHFKQWGYHVMQTNRDSHLRCFDFVDFDEALRKAVA